MPEATAIQVAEQFRAQLLAQERASAVRMVNAYGDVYRRLQSQTDALIADLDAMTAKGETLKPWKVQKLERLKALQRQVEVEASRFATVAENEITQNARTLITTAQAHARALSAAALPGVAPLDAQIMATWQSLNPAAVETMLGFTAPESPVMTGLREKFGPALAQSVGDKLVEGIALGYNSRKTAAIIQQAMGEGLSWIMNTSRTTQLYAYREATRAAYMANPGIVKGWIWRAARDGRCCMSCVAMDGTEHKPDERLNDHHQGRCAMVPITVTYRELGLNVDEPAPVLREPTGEAWFRQQSPTLQKQMMGVGKWDAWASGKVKLADMTQETEDAVWGKIRTEAPLKALV